MRGCLLRTKEVVGLNQTPTAESASLVSASIRDTHRRGKHTSLRHLYFWRDMCKKEKKKHKKNVIVIDRKQE